ncbi:DUF3105 domain-containing protein [Glaciibacter sp. 2TAF33]|uniref:DUF3105 domain-containing protein n=1 Tax=Glaciibacter sp. 2TAF33 TaxID=3233015 RepID=UPI003F93856C
MTPAPSSGSNSNGSLTVKQQRAENRARKLEEYHRQQKRSARNRRIGIITGVVAVVAVLGVVITSIVLTPQQASYSAGSSGATVKGVETFTNTANHVETPVTYAQTPPVGGEHNPVWLNCGVYTEPVPNENAVHALEHGAIWVTYDPSLSATELDALKAKLPSTYVVLSPFEGLPSDIVLSGWNVQLQVDSASDERIGQFFEEYWKGGTAPELGASCSGAFDAPGKVS